jgi:SAM-dependent methyltransferase
MSKGKARFAPPWWDHQRHPLIALRNCVEFLLFEHIPSGSGEKVYDIGCGERPYESLLKERGYEYIGCDLDGEPDVLIHPGRPLEAKSGTAAGVASFQVLEHVWDLDWYLGECWRLLRPDGWLLLSTHGVWPYHPHPTDFRRWTHTGLRYELESRGFNVTEIRGLVGPLAWTTQVRALGFRHVLQRAPVTRMLAPIVAALMNARMAVEDMVTPASILYDNASIYVALCRRREVDAPGALAEHSSK